MPPINTARRAQTATWSSAVSLWEAIIKSQIGKLPLPGPPEIYLPAQRERHRIASLLIDESDMVELAKLPPIHRDPFDRMLIAQAEVEGIVLVTSDDRVVKYPGAIEKV